MFSGGSKYSAILAWPFQVLSFEDMNLRGAESALELLDARAGALAIEMGLCGDSAKK